MQATDQGPHVIVRAPTTDAEVEAYFRMAVLAFWPNANQADRADWWQRFITSTPGWQRDHLRCAFRGDTIVGGCVVHTRTLRMPPTALTTSCIALVATDPAFRRRGIARAIMEDVIARAKLLGHDLLLLGGVPNFYDQWGYVDVFDGVDHHIDRTAALALAPTDATVRAASADDTTILRALYQRYHYAYRGSFERTDADQAHHLRFRDSDNPPYIAWGPDGTPKGYMLPSSGSMISTLR